MTTEDRLLASAHLGRQLCLAACYCGCPKHLQEAMQGCEELSLIKNLIWGYISGVLQV